MRGGGIDGSCGGTDAEGTPAAFYGNIFGRGSDAEGLEFWTGILARPGSDLSDLPFRFTQGGEGREVAGDAVRDGVVMGTDFFDWGA